MVEVLVPEQGPEANLRVRWVHGNRPWLEEDCERQHILAGVVVDVRALELVPIILRDVPRCAGTRWVEDRPTTRGALAKGNGLVHL